MRIHEKVVCVCGGESLLKMLGEKSFWGGIENFRFCLGGELTLDDTMMYHYHPKLQNFKAKKNLKVTSSQSASSFCDMKKSWLVKKPSCRNTNCRHDSLPGLSFRDPMEIKRKLSTDL